MNDIFYVVWFMLSARKYFTFSLHSLRGERERMNLFVEAVDEENIFVEDFNV